jgi:hypothetical protein
MARFGSTASFVINTSNGGHKKYPAGQTYADTQGNALAGDVVWASVGSSASMSPNLIPLDGAATTIKNASRFANQNNPWIDGVNSIG